MELLLKQYKFEKVETDSKKISLPTKTEYYFETGIRRSIKVEPIYTNYREPGERETLQNIRFTLIYLSWETKIEVIEIPIREFEEIYFNEKDNRHNLVKAYFEGWFYKRTKENFNSDYHEIIKKINA